MSFAKYLQRSIKALQLATLVTFCAVVASGMIVLWALPEKLEDFKAVLAAMGPYVFPMFGFAFLGDHVKNLSEAVKAAAENNAKKKSDDLQGVVG
jgi:hypothetical protein